MTFKRNMPWVRETASQQPTVLWSYPGVLPSVVVHRDGILLGLDNSYVDRQNFTSKPISTGAFYNEFKAKVIQAATIVDSDNDRLPDQWEMSQFGSLTAATQSTVLSDGRTAFDWMCFPSISPITSVIENIASSSYFQLNSRIRTGKWGGLIYILTPLQEAEIPTLVRRSRNFDGSGTETVTFELPLSGQLRGFYKVEAGR